MISRRAFLNAVGLAVTACVPAVAAAAAQTTQKPKLATVTLVIDGMI